jgi:hypothetical protein
MQVYSLNRSDGHLQLPQSPKPPSKPPVSSVWRFYQWQLTDNGLARMWIVGRAQTDNQLAKVVLKCNGVTLNHSKTGARVQVKKNSVCK